MADRSWVWRLPSSSERTSSKRKDGSILTYQLYKLQFGQLQRKGGGTLLALGAKPSDIDTIYNKIDIIL